MKIIISFLWYIVQFIFSLLAVTIFGILILITLPFRKCISDYLGELSKEEYLWYAQFTDEWTNAAIEKTADGKVKRGHIHTTNEMARNIYDANNKRNNDIYTVTKALNLMSELDVRVGEANEYIEARQVSNTNLTEMATIAEIENVDTRDAEFLTKREFMRMVKHGTKIPKEMYNFYIDFYKLELKKA
jgi:hypothetical protein